MMLIAMVYLEKIKWHSVGSLLVYQDTRYTSKAMGPDGIPLIVLSKCASNGSLQATSLSFQFDVAI